MERLMIIFGVPPEHLDAVLEAMAEAGAGVIGVHLPARGLGASCRARRRIQLMGSAGRLIRWWKHGSKRFVTGTRPKRWLRRFAKRIRMRSQ
jgi:hypothetical protein